MLPLSGLLLVLFVGWRLKKAIYEDETLGVSRGFANGLYFLVRFVAPISIAIILGLSIWGLPEIYKDIFG
jgi:NSS family neurotransmitter:Na+ symporter